ncbi:MAG TPA: hypothetical protein VE266_12120 [Steroidobacteraceae bacterium]|nr:hypothetical protein [Steroidobacteraceae bacterium]
MVVARSVTTVVASLALAGLAGCATRGNLTNATEDLESSANALVRDAGNEIADHAADESRRSDYAAEYAHDARALARHAHELRLAVEDRATDSEVRAAFDRVRRSYHAVRDGVAHSDSRVAQRDFDPVTDSYRAVEHELAPYPDRDEHVPPT